MNILDINILIDKYEINYYKTLLSLINNDKEYIMICLSNKVPLAFHLNPINVQEEVLDEHINRQEFSSDRLYRDSELIKLVGKL